MVPTLSYQWRRGSRAEQLRQAVCCSMVHKTAPPHALALRAPKQLEVLGRRAEPPAQPLLGRAGFGPGGFMNAFLGHASNAAAMGGGCWTQQALPRGKSVCKQPLCLQPGPGTHLGLFRAGQSWQRSQCGSIISPLWFCLRSRGNPIIVPHGSTDAVHLAQHITGRNPR